MFGFLTSMLMFTQNPYRKSHSKLFFFFFLRKYLSVAKYWNVTKAAILDKLKQFERYFDFYDV